MSLQPTLDKLFSLPFASDSTHLICPKCGNDCCHLSKVTVNQNGMVTTVRRDNDTLDPDGPKTGRGSHVYVHCFCESGCLFAMEFSFHKGNTYFNVADEGDAVPGTDVDVEELWRD